MNTKVEDLAEAIRGLDDEDRQALIGRLARDSDFVEDLLDTIEILRSHGEPVRPYDELDAELKTE